MLNNEKLYWLGFSVFPGIGPKKFAKLLDIFDSAENAWKAEKEKLETILGNTLAEKFILFRKKFDFEKYWENLVKKNIHIITLLNKEYPNLLKSIVQKEISKERIGNLKLEIRNLKFYKPPFLLFVKGNISLLNSKRIIAVVGTRKITHYGEEVTKLLTSQLVQNGFTIVSGLAFGVDAAAHMTAIHTGCVFHTPSVEQRGTTIAVLGCGVDCCTPSANQQIYDRILDSGGTIISAFPPGTQPTKGSFPARNAIIAGLSQGVLVTEGTEDSGALITAQWAREFGRPVFAVPGPITSLLSRGVNNLISQGAIAVTGVKDILLSLKMSNTTNVPLSGTNVNPPAGGQMSNEETQKVFSEEEKKILNMLQLNPMHFDEIVRQMGEDAKRIGSLLSLMEIKGMIKNNNSTYYLII